MKTLDLHQAQHFMVLYSNYSVYSMVKAVRDDVKNAADQCAENNKDMKAELNKKFDEWDASVVPTMEQADKNIQSMALAQSYIPQSELKVIYLLVDQARAENSSRFETTPLTTPEACEFMMSKMDETAKSMNLLLQSTLISYPQMLRKNQR